MHEMGRLARIALLVVAGGLVGCGPATTSPEASEELAQAYRARMRDEPLRAWGRLSLEEHVTYKRELVVQQTLFAGADEGIAIDDELRDALRAYWDGNVALPTTEGAALHADGDELAALRAPLAAYNEELEARYTPLAELLLARIERDPDDTAARGLLALSVLLHQQSTQGSMLSYPRTALLDQLFGPGEPAIAPPACALFSDTPGASGAPLDCRVAIDDQLRVGTHALDRAFGWYDEIQATAPDSTWIDIGRRIAEPAQPDDPDLTLPRSTTQQPPELAPNVVISRAWIALDGKQLVQLDDGGTVPAASRRGAMITPLLDELARDADTLAHIAERNPEQPVDHRVLVQCDAELPFALLRDVLWTAAQAGFHRPELVVRKSGRERAIQRIHLGVIPVSLPAISVGGDPDALPPPVVQLTAEGFAVAGEGEGVAEAAARAAGLMRPPASAWGDPMDRQLVTRLAGLHATRPDTREVSLVVADDVPYRQVVATLDALQRRCTSADSCEPLFPRVVLSTGAHEPIWSPTEREIEDAVEALVRGLGGTIEGDIEVQIGH